MVHNPSRCIHSTLTIGNGKHVGEMGHIQLQCYNQSLLRLSIGRQDCRRAIAAAQRQPSLADLDTLHITTILSCCGTAWSSESDRWSLPPIVSRARKFWREIGKGRMRAAGIRVPGQSVMFVVSFSFPSPKPCSGSSSYRAAIYAQCEWTRFAFSRVVEN